MPVVALSSYTLTCRSPQPHPGAQTETRRPSRRGAQVRSKPPRRPAPALSCPRPSAGRWYATPSGVGCGTLSGTGWPTCRPGAPSWYGRYPVPTSCRTPGSEPISMRRSPPPGPLVGRGGDPDEQREQHSTGDFTRCPNAGRTHHRVPSLDKPGTAGPLSVLPVVQCLRLDGDCAARCAPGSIAGGTTAAALPPFPPWWI